MTPPDDGTNTTRLDRARKWLKSDVTLILPGWVFAAAGAVALVLVIVAFD